MLQLLQLARLSEDPRVSAECQQAVETSWGVDPETSELVEGERDILLLMIVQVDYY